MKIKESSGPKILFFDIENTPLLGWAWSTYETNLLGVVKDTELLSFAYKIDNGPIRVLSRRLYTEKELAKALWKLFDEAEVLIGHNGDSFDIKMANQYFIKYKLPPPSPYKSVDTKKMAKKSFRFAQNKLDYLGQFLYKEGKISTNMDLWFKCMDGDTSALLKMERYNKQDVALLFKVYQTLRPWSSNHPNHNLYVGTTHQCPVCGGHTHKRGYMFTRVGKYQRYQCQTCAAWSKGEKINSDKVIS